MKRWLMALLMPWTCGPALLRWLRGDTGDAAMKITTETATEQRLREIGAARLVAQRLRRARARVGCDEVEDRDDAPCWKGSSEPHRCASCDATLVLSHALDRVREDERKARRSLNRIAERMILTEGRP